MDFVPGEQVIMTESDAVNGISNSSKQENLDLNDPGRGWSNGDLELAMFSVTREGRMALYSTHRRWINTNTSWTRIGEGFTEHSASTDASLGGKSTVKSLEDEARTIRALIAQKCEHFYRSGWATGTGGGVSIRVGGPSENRPWRVFVAPSGIQKEDMIGDDIYEYDMDGNIVVFPKCPNLRPSACTPLWYVVYRNRPSSRCVIHTHSMNAQMATLLDPTEKSKTFKITHLEMLKGVGNHAYDDLLEIPIIDNRPTEDELAEQLEFVVNAFPKTNAVLVRRHGLYCWGDSWEQAKTQCESFDFLFESAVKMRSIGVDFSVSPKEGTYRMSQFLERKNGNRGSHRSVMDVGQDDNGGHDRRSWMNVEKREGGSATGFNDASYSNNAIDMSVSDTTVPILPRDAKILLLDIEGCTTSIASVKDILFPYVLEHIDETADNMDSGTLQSTLDMLVKDVEDLKNAQMKKKCEEAVPRMDEMNADSIREAVKVYVKQMVKLDVKATGLKALQGKIWEEGFISGQLHGHVYPDFKPFLDWCRAHNIAVYIYSSGSVKAQKLLFRHSVESDLTSYFAGHFDTTIGQKKEASSYVKIAEKLGVSPNEIVFASDSERELAAAHEAEIGFPVMSVRPGNVPLTDVGKSFPIVRSLLQLCGA